MNRQFYEFWGNFFINVAQGQKQLEDMSTWMKKGFSGSDDLTTLFQQCYGLKSPGADTALDPKAWQNAFADFQQTFNQFAEQWGWVPQTRHQQMLDKCAELEKKVQQQQSTITKLRSLLEQEGKGHAELFQHYKGSLEEQSNQFQELMKSLGKVVKDKPGA